MENYSPETMNTLAKSLHETQQNAISTGEPIDQIMKMALNEKHAAVVDSILADPSISAEQKVALVKEVLDGHAECLKTSAEIYANVQTTQTRNVKDLTIGWGEMVAFVGLGLWSVYEIFKK